MTTSDRIELLLTQAAALERWTGSFDRRVLENRLENELGHCEALDRWVPYGSIFSRAVALSPVLHVVSGNTAHAAFQSVFRGLLVGAHNHVKLPRAGLPEFEEWVGHLPEELRTRVEIRHELPEEWLEPEVAVIFGNEETIATFRRLLPANVRRIEHGPKWSIAAIFEPTAEAARRVAEDVLRHEQRGCLSVQAVFVDGEVAAFGELLAEAMRTFRDREGLPTRTVSESGAVSNARAVARFRQANGEPLKLWESEGSTSWTVLMSPDPRLSPGPLNGFVTLHPFPENFSEAALGAEAAFVSTVSIWPFTPEHAERLSVWAPPRICEAGKAQEPTIFWHHDGMRPLADLVRWRDLG